MLTGSHAIANIVAVAAAMNVGFNVVLIPRYAAAAAVFTTLLAEFVVTVGALIVRRRIARIPALRIVYRPLICSVALAVMVRGAIRFWQVPWWAAAMLGTLLFAACFWLFEKDTIKQLAKRVWCLPTKPRQ